MKTNLKKFFNRNIFVPQPPQGNSPNNKRNFWFILLLLLATIITITGIFFDVSYIRNRYVYIVTFSILLFVFYKKGILPKCKFFDNTFSELSTSIRILLPLVFFVESYILQILFKLSIVLLFRLLFKGYISIGQFITTFLACISLDMFSMIHNVRGFSMLDILNEDFSVFLPVTIDQRSVDMANRAIQHVRRLPADRIIEIAEVTDAKLKASGGSPDKYTQFTYEEHAVIKVFLSRNIVDNPRPDFHPNNPTHPSLYGGWVIPGKFESPASLRITGSTFHQTRFYREYHSELVAFKSLYTPPQPQPKT